MLSVPGSLLLLLALFTITYFSFTSQHSSPDIPSLLPHSSRCQPFEGNPDFYGLGIRLGVYLQWSSSWLTNTLNPNAAAVNHDANSIFVLAIIVVVFVSVGNSTIQPVEAYIMLLFCFGFFYTVLSYLGIRLYLMDATSSVTLVKRIQDHRRRAHDRRIAAQQKPSANTIGSIWAGVFPSRKETSASNQSPWQNRLYSLLKPLSIWQAPAAFLGTLKLAISFKTASFLKHPSVSWGGVAWRSAIASLVSAANIWLWFFIWKARSDVSDEGSCTTTVFLFGERELRGRMITFLKAASVILAIPDFYLCLFFFHVISASFRLAYAFTVRYLTINFLESRREGLWDDLPVQYKLFLGLFANMTTGQSSAIHQFKLLSELRPEQESEKFWAVKKEDLPESKDLINAQISFWCRGIEAQESAEATDVESPGVVARTLCVSFHLLILATISYFVTFIEVTISQNGISGVYTIGTTGQLIPFIIGLVSFVAAIREILFLRLRKKYPEWHAYFLSLDVGLGVMQLNKVNAQQVDSEKETQAQQQHPSTTTSSNNPQTLHSSANEYGITVAQDENKTRPSDGT